MTVTVPDRPVLARIPNVELMQTGMWGLGTGQATFTTDDLRSAVAALGCPAVRRPVLKLGHTDPRFDGEPAVGWVDNLGVADDGRTLVGDYAGIPTWLADVMASAYPDRSIEGYFDFVCQLGHTHPFALTAVALLGVTRPGIGTLESLQDVAELYGIAAAAGTAPTGTPVAIHASGGPMPNPTPVLVAASVTADDVSRAFYASRLGSGWMSWIEELQLDPLQVIYVDDDAGTRNRVPVVVGSGDGADAVTFGDPVPVVITYVDAPTGVAAAAGTPPVIRYASRAESRPGTPPDPQATAPAAVDPAPPSTEGEPMAFHDDLRKRLGLADDASEADITAAVDAALAVPAENAPTSASAPAPPEGTVLIEAGALEGLRRDAAAGAAARAEQLAARRSALVGAAVNDGRIPPARREHWTKQLEADSGAEAVLASLAPGLIPVGAPIGHSPESDSQAADNSWFGSAQKSKEA